MFVVVDRHDSREAWGKNAPVRESTHCPTLNSGHGNDPPFREMITLEIPRPRSRLSMCKDGNYRDLKVI